MNHLIEQLVKDYRHHMQALESFGTLAIEVYIAYLLERVIERFHETIAKLLFWGLVKEKMKEGWEALREDIIPNVAATIGKMPAMLLQSAKRLREKMRTFLSLIGVAGRQ